MISASHQFTPKQLNDRVVKFQSLYRGYITRKYTLLPTASLNANLCIQINDLFKAGRKEVSDVTREINKEKRLFLNWSKKQGMISLLFTSEQLVGAGFWKKFFSSITIKILLNTKKREVTQFESVWTVVDSKTLEEIKIQDFLYEQFNQQKPKNVYFLEPLERMHQNIYTQRRLINQLEETKFKDPFQKSHCMRDLARNLVWMHKQGVVHGDISLKNILIEERIDNDGVLRFVCYLTDLGSAKKWGAEQDRKLDDYVRWDPSKCFADINTPLMDWYGFVVTNIIAWFPEMASCLKWERFISTRRMIFLNQTNRIFISDASYWNGSKSYSDLSFMERRAWHLFVLICEKSSQLCLGFKNIPGKISKEEVEIAMKKIDACGIEKECLQFAEEMCALAKTLPKKIFSNPMNDVKLA